MATLPDSEYRLTQKDVAAHLRMSVERRLKVLGPFGERQKSSKTEHGAGSTPPSQPRFLEMSSIANITPTFEAGQLVRFFSNGWHYSRVLESDGRFVIVKHYRKLKRKKTLEVPIDMVEAVETERG